MQIRNITDLKAIIKVQSTLSKNGVLLHPTETCYGFAVDIFQQEALEKLYQVKQMQKDKPVSIMIQNLEQAEQYGVFNDFARKLAQQFWPGPLTIIVPRQEQNLPSFLNSAVNNIGFRCPAHDFTQNLLKTYGKPLATTSANISGFPEAYDINTYLQQLCEYYKVPEVAQIPLENLPDLIIDGGTLAINPPSTIVDASCQPAVIIRKGSLAEQIAPMINL